MKLWTAICLALGLALASFADTSYPAITPGTDSDTFHGVMVTDPYRSLEESSTPSTLDWLSAERRVLNERIGPLALRRELRARLLELSSYTTYSKPVRVGRTFLWSESQPGQGGGATALMVQRGPRAKPRALVSAERYGRGARLASFSASPGGGRVAFSVTDDAGRLAIHVLDLSSGRERSSERIGPLSRVGNGAIVAWLDEQRFVYTASRVPDGTTAAIPPSALFLHRLGTSQDHDSRLDLPLPPRALVIPRTTEDGTYLVVTVRTEGTRSTIYVCNPRDAKWDFRRVAGTGDDTFTFLGKVNASLYFFTDRDAPRGRIVRADVSGGDLTWTTVVPEQEDALAAHDQTGGDAVGLYGNRLVLMYLRDGKPYLRLFSLSGRSIATVDLPTAGSIWGGFSGSQQRRDVYYQFLGLLDPSTIYRLDVTTGRTSVFRAPKVALDRRAYDVTQNFYSSADGTRIPMFVVKRRDRPAGPAPTYLYGYGSLGWVSFIWYQPQLIEWLDRGGVYAQPSLRGGGEYGEAWHAAGLKERKVKTIEDYVSAAEWLVKNGTTTPSLLVANGGSLSAPIAGAAITRRPDLFRAAVLDRPVLDLIRYPRFTGAAYWLPEFGSPTLPGEFTALFANSPYHRIRSGTCYPATLVMAGGKDLTAVPAHAYKFTAALQAAQACDRPVLLKVMQNAAHNFGATAEEVADSFADELTFLLTQLRRVE